MNMLMVHGGIGTQAIETHPETTEKSPLIAMKKLKMSKKELLNTHIYIQIN